MTGDFDGGGKKQKQQKMKWSQQEWKAAERKTAVRTRCLWL